ncbi:VWA domain-containing protein [Rickettsiales bacterium]|nr:VWA domain-containing protein [Rickettsiales bacterium]
MGHESFIFQWPQMAILVLLPLIFRLIVPASKDHGAVSKLIIPASAKIKEAFGTSKSAPVVKSRLEKFMLYLIWVLCVIALMRPQIVNEYTHVNNEGYDLMLAVDLSGSMKALDFEKNGQRINRLQATKEVVGNFVKDRRGDRVGLVLFGSNAYLHVPLTLDTISVSDMLNNAVIGMAGDSTAIGDAIGVAVKNLRHRPTGSRVIILLTDGSNTAGTVPPIEAAKLAEQYGIRIYTIGVGSHGAVPFPNQFGQIIMAEMKMDEDLLKEIAKITGGVYFRATNEKALGEIYAKINKMEKSESEAISFLTRRPLYKWPTGLAFSILLIMIIGRFAKNIKFNLP